MSRTQPDECAERVDAAVAASEAHWRARELNHLATIELLQRENNALRTQLAIRSEEE